MCTSVELDGVQQAMRPQEREIDREAERDEQQRAERPCCRDPELLAGVCESRSM